MAPIHDTDIAEERWSKAEWEHYELWERTKLRLRRRKVLWISGTLWVFLILSSVPVILDRWPKWLALSLTRKLAQEISRLKKEASLSHSAFRIRFEGEGKLDYQVEKSDSCSGGNWVSLRTGSLLPGSSSHALVNATLGEQLGIPGLVESFCYDSRVGFVSARPSGQLIQGFGIIPAKDLTDGRQDRMALLVLEGSFAEPSFDFLN